MSNPIWVPARAANIIHDCQIARSGDASGPCKEGLLKNVLQRISNKYHFEYADIFECAAAYAFGTAKAHAFVDGNKRTAFFACVLLLRINGWHFVTEPDEGVSLIEGFASNEVSEEKFKN